MSLDLRLKPKTSDGRPIHLASRFRGDVDPSFAGCDDAGTLFELHWDSAPASPETKTMEWSFNDWVYISKGTISWQNAASGDYVAFKVYAPATTVTANAGSGNCNLVDTGLGFNAIVPAQGDGSHDLSLPVPVPTFTDGEPKGNWLWDEPDTGLGNMSWVGDGKQMYNLYDVPLDLVRWIRKLPVIGDDTQILDPETKARKVLPHWKFKVEVRNETKGLLCMTWHLDLARKKTT